MNTADIKNISFDTALKDYKNLINNDDDNLKSRIGGIVNDYFFFDKRIQCKTKKGYTFIEWLEINKDKPYVKSMVKFYIEKKEKSEIVGLYHAFQLYSNSGSIGAFKPIWAKILYKRLNATSVLDFCAGWGGRALGAMALDIDYVGYDTNTTLIDAYTKMFANCKTNGNCKIIFQDSSTADFSELSYDMVLTSPPYFVSGNYSQERYPNMIDYGSVDEFNRKFYIPVIKAAFKHLKVGGSFCLNIPESMYDTAVLILGKCDEIIDISFGSRHNSKKKSYSEYVYRWIRKEIYHPPHFLMNG